MPALIGFIAVIAAIALVYLAFVYGGFFFVIAIEEAVRKLVGNPLGGWTVLGMSSGALIGLAISSRREDAPELRTAARVGTAVTGIAIIFATIAASDDAIGRQFWSTWTLPSAQQHPIRANDVVVAEAVRGFNDLTPRSTYSTNEIVCGYLETQGLPINGRVQSSWRYRLMSAGASSDTPAIIATSSEVNDTGQDPRWAGWDCFDLRANRIQPGNYVFVIEVTNHLTGETISRQAAITVQAARRTSAALRRSLPPGTSRWNGTFTENGQATEFVATLRFMDGNISGSIVESGRTATVNGSWLLGGDLQFIKQYEEHSVSYSGRLGVGNRSMSGHWSTALTSGRWAMTLDAGPAPTTAPQ